MAALFGVDINTFVEGDSFEFFGSATTVDGLVYDYRVTDCECPVEPDDPAGNGTWSGDRTDAVLMTASGLLQAFNFEVEFEDVPEE